jgi:hypothetical protein
LALNTGVVFDDQQFAGAFSHRRDAATNAPSAKATDSQNTWSWRLPPGAARTATLDADIEQTGCERRSQPTLSAVCGCSPLTIWRVRATLPNSVPQETAADRRDYPWLPSGSEPDSAPSTPNRWVAQMLWMARRITGAVPDRQDCQKVYCLSGT